MKNKKGFTLIELLAVIIILGVLLLVAIPSVTTYINSSKKDSYIATAKQYIKAASNMVNAGEFDVYDPTITYYIPAKCIPLESGGQSPYGDFDRAYVAVTYDGNGFKFYWQSRDVTGMGIPKATSVDDLTKDSVKSGVKKTAVKTTDTLDHTYRVNVLSEETCKLEYANDNFAYIVNPDDMVTEEYELIPQNSLSINDIPNVTFYNKNGTVGSTFHDTSRAFNISKAQYGVFTYTTKDGYKHTQMFYTMPKYKNKADNSIHYVAKIIWISFLKFRELDDTYSEYGFACVAHDPNENLIDCDVKPLLKTTGCTRQDRQGCTYFDHDETRQGGLYAILDNNDIVSLYHPQVSFHSIFGASYAGMTSTTFYPFELVEYAIVND